MAGQAVEKVIESEAELVHKIWLQYADIVDHPLIDVSLEAAAVEHESGGDVELVIPTEASEPVRPGTLDEIDSRRELVFIGDVVGQGQVVARQPPSGDIRSREKFEQLLRNRRHAGGGNHVVREWLAGQRIADHCAGRDLREVARAHSDRRQAVHALGWLCSRKPSRLDMKKRRFLPLNSLGMRTGPPSVKPYWFHLNGDFAGTE